MVDGKARGERRPTVGGRDQTFGDFIAYLTQYDKFACALAFLPNSHPQPGMGPFLQITHIRLRAIWLVPESKFVFLTRFRNLAGRWTLG